MSDRLTGELWEGAADIYRAILGHPFITGLTDGSLSPDAFRFYLVQDAMYLRDYARALAVLAGRAPRTADTQMFARHAADAIAVEQDLHGSLLAELGVDPALAAAAEPAPTALAYTSYLLAVTRGGSYAEGVAAVLPCYWIYWEVGRELIQRGSPDPRYQRWISTYGGDHFGEVVTDVLTAAGRLEPAVSAAERAAMRRHFRVTTRYEWMFWDMGYRQEAWPAALG